MQITIIIQIVNSNLLEKSLNILIQQSISDNLEIICINKNFDDTSKITAKYCDKFHKIIIIDKNSENSLYSALQRSTGEYVLLTDSNQLASSYYTDETMLENVYESSSASNDTDVLIYNINKNQVIAENYEFLDSLIDNISSFKDLTKTQVISLCNLNCDVIFSNKFRLYDTEYKDIKELDILKLKTFMNSDKLFIMDDFSEVKQVQEKLILRDNDGIIKNNLSRYYDQFNSNSFYITSLPQEEFKPLISIIIPLYNPLTNDILRLFYSIINQTFDFHKLEVIFINDCSTYTDGIDTIKKFTLKYPNIHIYNTQIISGNGITRNIGLNNTKGKYVMFLDQYSSFLENACESLYSTINKYDVDVVCGNFFEDTSENKDLGEISEEYCVNPCFKDFSEAIKLLNVNSSVCSNIYNKDFLDVNNLRFSKNKFLGDMRFMLNILLTNSKIVHIDNPIDIRKNRKTSHLSPDDVFILIDILYEIDEFYEIYASECKHLFFNNVYKLTLNIIKNSSLNFNEFKLFIEKSLNLFREYQKNQDRNKDSPIKKFLSYSTQLDYINAFKEYNKLRNNIPISPELNRMIFSIIVNVYDKDLLEKGLESLLNNFQFNLEIICVKRCNEDLTNTINMYNDKFYNIKIINYKNDEYFFNKEISEPNGEYILLTNLNNLISPTFIVNLNEIYIKATKNSYEINLFNLTRFEEKQYNEILDSLKQKELNTDDLTLNELYTLYNVDCSILISHKLIYKVNHEKIMELSSEPLTYIDVLIKSEKIYITDSLTKENKKLKIPDDNTQKDRKKIQNRIKSIINHTQPKNYPDKIIKYPRFNSEKYKNPKISIIIPVYNPKSRDIQITLNSIFNQTFDFNNLEIIFINDQSDDKKSIKLIEQYTLEYPNIKLYHTTVNSGPGLARNIGLDHANGEYIMFLDHDDYYLSNACEILYETIEKEDAELVLGNYIRVNMDFKRIKWDSINIFNYKNVTKNIDETYKFLKTNHTVWQLIYRKEFLDKNNIRFNDYRISEDKIFNYTCLLKDSKNVFINQAITVYEKRNPSKNGERSITLEKNIDNLITRVKARYQICDLFNEYAPKYKYILLDDVDYLTEILLTYNLKFKYFKKYIDVSYKFYSDYMDTNKTKKDPKTIKLCKFIAQKDYIKAYREYVTFRNKILLEEY